MLLFLVLFLKFFYLVRSYFAYRWIEMLQHFTRIPILHSLHCDCFCRSNGYGFLYYFVVCCRCRRFVPATRNISTFNVLQQKCYPARSTGKDNNNLEMKKIIIFFTKITYCIAYTKQAYLLGYYSCNKMFPNFSFTSTSFLFV